MTAAETVTALLAVMLAALLAVILVRPGIRKGRIVTSLPSFAAAAAFG
jgi:biopolymer transport protein ExbD